MIEDLAAPLILAIIRDDVETANQLVSIVADGEDYPIGFNDLMRGAAGLVRAICEQTDLDTEASLERACASVALYRARQQDDGTSGATAR